MPKPALPLHCANPKCTYQVGVMRNGHHVEHICSECGFTTAFTRDGRTIQAELVRSVRTDSLSAEVVDKLMRSNRYVDRSRC